MNKTVFITGATSGIGKACAEKFGAMGFNLVINGRRVDRLKQLSKELKDTYGINVFTSPFDVRKKEDVFNAVESLNREVSHIDVLINNAGLALGKENFEDADISDWETMIATNVSGLLYTTKAVLPLLHKSSHPIIINIGSIAGKEVYKDGNVYCATKFAVDAISKSLRIDLLKKGVRVTAIHPGAVETEFSLVRFKGDEESAAAAYTGYKPLTADDVADNIFYCATLPPHVCINDLVVTCTQQANVFYFEKK
ncbi:MAG: SDR family NAD(P)-dependent oxidoreductase [Sphingobacteriales bacterium]|nr:MAG: SDR family NAD(P)-dependent oxidoreductase [Sphingobacteriales bacterium]